MSFGECLGDDGPMAGLPVFAGAEDRDDRPRFADRRRQAVEPPMDRSAPERVVELTPEDRHLRIPTLRVAEFNEPLVGDSGRSEQSDNP